MIEALRMVGTIAMVTFLGINVLLQFFLYPFYLTFASLERMYITDDDRRSLKLFDNFWVDVWIPSLLFTLVLSLLACVGVTILYYLRQLY